MEGCWINLNQYKSLTPRLALNLAAPHTWAASILPALFGDIYCLQQGIELSWWKGILLVAACIFLQSAVNTLNDYFDFIKGNDSEEDFVERSDAVLIYEKVSPRSVLYLAIYYVCSGAVLGLTSCAGSGMVPILIAVVGGAVIFLYSGGPLPLSYLPIGELVSGVVMGGLIPLGIAACADGSVHWKICVYSIPLTLGIALIMMSNNGSDIEKDIKADRNTLPTCLGRERTRILYRGIMILWIFMVVLLPVAALGAIGWISLLLIILGGLKTIRTQFSYTLNPEQRIRVMKGIAKTNLILNGAYIVAFAAAYLLEVLYG